MDEMGIEMIKFLVIGVVIATVLFVSFLIGHDMRIIMGISIFALVLGVVHTFWSKGDEYVS